MMAVQKYKLRLLAFTLDNGFISPTAFKNIHNVITATGVDHLTFRPSSTFLNALIKTSALEPIYNKKTLTRISSICNSCISIVNMTALKIALEKEIPFIIAGFTLGQIPANSIVYKNNYRFFEESRQPVLNRLRESVGPDVDNYLCISDRILDSSDSYPHNLNLLCLEDISEKDMINAIRKVGWSPPDDVDGCSSNCSLNGFNNFVHQKTFDYSPYELELSHLIKKGKLTRSEALQKITDQLKPEGIKAIMTELKIDSSDIEKLSEIY
jgi:tRNA(Ile)-lysidine synthase TilS/MesJ